MVEGQFHPAVADRRPRQAGQHERLDLPPSLPLGDRAEPLAVPEATAPAGGHSDAATAAFQVGYESPSPFSREYSRLFGAPPLRDIMNLRQVAAGASE